MEGVIQKNQRISVLASGSHRVTDFTKESCLSNGLTKRFESTAAASDTASPPAEKYEYQAEVFVTSLYFSIHNFTNSNYNYNFIIASYFLVWTFAALLCKFYAILVIATCVIIERLCEP